LLHTPPIKSLRGNSGTGVRTYLAAYPVFKYIVRAEGCKCTASP